MLGHPGRAGEIHRERFGQGAPVRPNRGVLPFRAAAPPVPHQCLPDALAPQEIQAAGICEEGQGLLEARHRPVPPAVRPLGLGAPFLVVRMTGAG